MEVLRKKRIVAIVGLVSVLLGVLLPYYVVSVYGYTSKGSLIDNWRGVVILLLLIPNALFIFKDYIYKFLPDIFNNNAGRMILRANQKFSLIPTAIYLIISFVLLVDNDISFSNYAHYGIGFWLLWIGIICLIVHAFIYIEDNSMINMPVQPNMNSDMINQQNAMQPVNNQVNGVQPTNNQVNGVQQGQPNIIQSLDNQDINNQNVAQTYVTQVNEQLIQPINNVQSINNEPLNNSVKYCPKCGTQVDISVNFCPKCGTKL